MKLNVLTNSRPTVDLGEKLVVGCTNGQVKITPDFAEKLGLAPGNYIGVGTDPKTKKIFAFVAGEDAIARGNKLAKSGSYLTFSSANVWNELEGNISENRYFVAVGDAVTDDDGTFLEIEFDSAEPKQERKDSENKGDTSENTEEVEAMADTQTENDGEDF